ncbi:uncharacterized protein LOC117305123 [Asterias rubens]|uniref:uncharacterized protein LOC117305123 n=1 Tax=Asterias rubens TaxID=7604 RepID=UPI0014551DA6|nr:uncharacterized protein LOC117305123 [Asterias rubens]
MPRSSIGLRVAFVYFVIGLARSSICPADRALAIHDVTSATNGQVTIQQGILQQIPCTTFRPGESVAGVLWYRGNSDIDPRKERLIGQNDNRANQKYALTSYNGLIIKDVTKQDEGNYVCIVVPHEAINRYSVVEVHVIEGVFQAVEADLITTSSLAQSLRHRIPCRCGMTSSSTVYWSQGTGVTSGTDILGARFPGGTVLQFQGRVGIGVASTGSLILNSLQNTRETARFWCHVFELDGSLMNCYVDAKIVKDDEKPSNNALQSSTDSFYVLKGEDQTLPCTDGPISEQTCDVQWFKNASSEIELLVNYTALNDVTYDDAGFGLGSDFALLIKSADEENDGIYICKMKSGSQRMEVRVIGDTFPLDKGNISRVEEITFEPGQNYTLECTVGLNTTKSRTAFWSFGQKDAINTTVIGTFKSPDSLVNAESIGRNSCYSITVDGALLLTGCLIDSDVRYWCHVFLDGVLYRYYVDLVVVQDSSKSFLGPFWIIIPIIAIVIIVCLVTVLCWKSRVVKPSCSSYVMVDVEDSDAELIRVVKDEVMVRVARVPITPWATDDTPSCYKPMVDVYIPPQLFIKHKAAEHTIRYQLESDDQLFDDGISQLKSKHVILEGRAGSGKTTLLHKIAFEMCIGKAEALERQVRLVLVLTARVLLQHGNLGDAVFQQLGQPQHTKISPSSINLFCKRHTLDVAILVDDCEEVGQVLEFIRMQGLFGAYVVLATRQIRDADFRSEFDYRHVTVSGFTPTSSRGFIKCVLDNSKRSEELVGYLDYHILPPDVESLPLNLTALCQLSLWTDGEVFRRRLKTSELFCKLVKCLFDGAACRTKQQGDGSGQTMECHQSTRDQPRHGSSQTMKGHQPTRDQQGDGSGQTNAGHQPTRDQQGDGSGQTNAGHQPTQDQQGDGSGQTMKGHQPTRDQQGDGSGQTNAGHQPTRDQQGNGGGQTNAGHQPTRDQQGNGGGQTNAGHQPTRDQQGNGSGQTNAGHQPTQDQQGDGSGQTMKGHQPTRDQQGDGSGQTNAGHQPTRDQQGDVSGQTNESHQLSQHQQKMLVNLGKIVIPRVLQNHGLFCELSRKDVDQFVESTNSAFDEGVRVGLLRERVGGSASQTERTAYFVLEILQDLSVGISLTQTDKSLSSYLEEMVLFGTTFAKAFLFAGLPSHNAYPSIKGVIKKTLVDITSKLKSLTPVFGQSLAPIDQNKFLKLKQSYMHMIEMCLQLQHESGGGVSLPIKVRLLSVGSSPKVKGKIRLIGVSSHKLQLLSYSLTHLQTKSKIKSIKLLRFGKHPSKELRKYLGDFLPYVFEDTDKETSKLEETELVNVTLSLLLERFESNLRGEVDGSSSNLDLDTGVILAMQSPFLQDAMLSQSGECCSSTPARDFAHCLLKLTNLEEIVLIGSILDSKTICEMARNLKNFNQLKMLDLRLNEKIDDSAFSEVTQSVSSCRSLVDLRLSLYEVTLQGYDEVTRCLENDKNGWKRLKKLFLLHGNQTERFVVFLSEVMRYLKNINEFNIAALNSSEELSHEAIAGFESAFKSMKIGQKNIEIENMEDLRAKIKPASKDQKQQARSIEPAKESETCGVSETSLSTDEDFELVELLNQDEGSTEELESGV